MMLKLMMLKQRNGWKMAERAGFALAIALLTLLMNGCGGGGGGGMPSAFNPTRLTTSPANERQPAWSPDGRKIAFVSDRIGGTDGMDLFLITPNGTQEQLVAQFTVTDPWGGRFGEPSWLSNTNDLLIMDYKYFHEVMRFTFSQASMDGNIPVYRRQWDGNSSYFIRLLFVPGGLGASIPNTIIPSSTKLVWVSIIPNGRHQVRSAASNFESFIGDTDDAGELVFQTMPDGYIGGPKTVALSPDGTKIVVSACVQGWNAGKRRDIYVINILNGTVQRLTRTGENGQDNTYVAWSTTNLIAFASRQNDNAKYDLYVIRPDGTGLRRLTNTSWDEIEPSWSPDGYRLVFASDQFGNYDLYIGNVSE